jgi:transcriptional accessory protein Tex/SPT6
MSTTPTIDLRHVARGINIPLRQVQAVVELLDEGNTVPFITRYRKDQTGGLDEEQIRLVQGRLTKMRLLADRKQTILRSIEAQGKLTEELAQQIHAAGTTKRLEDLYLPFKPHKQTLATLARSRGLEDLAREILAADPLCADLDARARDFGNPDRQVPTGADALLGAGHILAEQFSERADLRQALREILQRTGKFISVASPEIKEKAEAGKAEGGGRKAEGGKEKGEGREDKREGKGEKESGAAAAADIVQPAAVTEVIEASQSAPVAEQATAADPPPDPSDPPGNPAPIDVAPVPAEAVADDAPSSEPSAAAAESPVEATSAPAEAVVVEAAEAAPAAPAADAAPVAPPPPRAAAHQVKKKKPDQPRLNKKELKKKHAEEQRIRAFRDYFDYSEEIKKIPPHRILAINRGERAKVLRVKLECDIEAMYAKLDEMLVPPGHPHADYLRGCARDALTRLILPGLEREVRRELTDRAETHAVEVFAKNLRNLLLQPPVRDRRVLAIDPGFKSGCKLAALDQFGNVLDHGVIFLVGKPDRKQQAKEKVLDLIQRFQLSAIVIGNGTACRAVEDFVSEMLDADLKARGVAYVIVNEAGASVYSTSRTGREEFPNYDATLRGAISIGRRLQDPLSELVKIDPANIGVGLYQHDVKGKHLQSSLDEVVESCVNYVGVDVNTASPALLRYVSGLNQLTARRVYEYRCEKGPFRSREQVRDVPGFGEATFVQAAGFLKITDGSNPLDATWIHPESYDAAGRVLAKLGCQASDLADKATAAAMAERVAGLNREELAKELAVGTHTLNDILAQLARPGRDPREDLPPPIFKQGVLKLEDLTPNLELTGTVLNVVDFGAFVDIGMHDSGLVHVSHLADKFVRDPHEVVAVGDIVKVWVLQVDKERRRVSLTMVKPGSERPRHPPHGAKPEGQATGTPPAGRLRSAEGRGGPPPRTPRPAGQRPPRPAGAPVGGQGGDRPPRAGERPPRGGDRGHGRPPYRGGPPQRTQYQPPKPKPKPIIPITEAMKEGKEPMRTFGDLLQFYEVKKTPESPKRVETAEAAEEKKTTAVEEKPAEGVAPVAVSPPVETPTGPSSAVGESPAVSGNEPSPAVSEPAATGDRPLLQVDEPKPQS